MPRKAELPVLPRARLARLALAAQGLHRDAPFGRGTRGVQRAIEHLGYVQIDTISVVARAHHHTLFTRVPDYQPALLDRLQERRRIFEYWFHAAAFLPMRDFRFALPRMLHMREHGVSWVPNRDRRFETELLARIASDGPLCTRDLEDKRESRTGWWDWSPAKRAIEALFFEGQLLCIGRDGFAKVYDLPERALPADVDATRPSDAEFVDYLVRTHLRSHGFGALKEFSYLRRGKPLREAINERIAHGIASGELLRARLDSDNAELIVDAEAIDTRPRIAPVVRVLSPFDSAVIQRDRSVTVHEYDYQIECYTPAAKRRYGYFCLPLQFGERLVGRADCKAERRDRVFRVQALYLERDDLDIDAFAPALATALRSFATFNECDEVVLDRVVPTRAASALKRALRADASAAASPSTSESASAAVEPK